MLFVSSTVPAAAAEPADGGKRKIVLIAGPKDKYHAPGTHDYAQTVETIQKALAGSNVAELVDVITVSDGWPTDPAILKGADTIFLVSAGADHDVSDHPFLRPERLKVLEQRMADGCGLVMLHWSLFVPVEHEEQFTKWIGGFFDYQRGQGEKGWYSAITFAKTTIDPNPKFAISRGIAPFEHRDEYYYHMRFAQDDARVKPVVTVELPDVGKPQVIGWTTQRKNGGRSFAFTGGHFQKSWDEDGFRKLMLNSICWTAHVPIPSGGVHEKLLFDDKWTPKPNIGLKNVPQESEKDWYDDRIRQMDTGPYFTASIVVPDPGEKPAPPKDNRDTPLNPDMVTDAIAIKLGGTKNLPTVGVLFDKQTMTLRCGWTGGFLHHSNRRFGLLVMPAIAETVDWWVPADARWSVVDDQSPKPADVEYKGLYLDGDRVVLSYSVEGCDVLESPLLAATEEAPIFVRTFEVGPTQDPITLPLMAWPGASIPDKADKTPEAPSTFGFEKDGDLILAAILPTDAPRESSVSLAYRNESECVLRIAPSEETRHFAVQIWPISKEKIAEQLFDPTGVRPELGSLSSMIKDPAPRWGKPITTEGKIAKPKPGAPFAVDTITIPYKNRYHALFYLTGLDFAPDGACYVSTGHGDVWKVTGIDEDLDKITWRRFATGLYQPLGVVVRNGEVFVIGRDQITRLHDTNGDGEADFYECFNDDLTDKGQSHAYAMCLETDADGNFYFLKSGAAGTPHGGSLIKVSADGEKMTRFATGFRNANGLSIGPKGTITVADNEGNWVPATRIDFVEKGEFCGYVPTAHRETVPHDPGTPLCWLPHVLDNSAGGQVWVPQGHWGPLSGQLIHFSWGLCTANLILKEKVNGVWQGGAVLMPLPRFLSGACRGRFRTSGDGADGHLYVCGLDGWSTAAAKDGSLERVRYLDRPLGMLTGLHVYENGVELVFPEPIDAELAGQADRYSVEVWNYRWTENYGSENYSVADPSKKGRDFLDVTAAQVSSDGRRVFLTVSNVQPVMQLRVQAGLRRADGEKLIVDYYGTIHELRPAR